MMPARTNAQVAFAGINSQCFYKGDPYCELTKSYEDRFVNIGNENKFVDDMTLQTRQARPVQYAVLPKGVSNIYLSRVLLDSYKKALYFAP